MTTMEEKGGEPLRALIQRVSAAEVKVEGEAIAQINHGLVIFVCAMKGDSEQNAMSLAKRIVNLRIFGDDAGKMNRSLLDVKGCALVVSQFTLAANMSRGNRPSFSAAAPANEGETLYKKFVDELQYCCHVETGRFAANMQVKLINDGPATFWLEID